MRTRIITIRIDNFKFTFELKVKKLDEKDVFDALNIICQDSIKSVEECSSTYSKQLKHNILYSMDEQALKTLIDKDIDIKYIIRQCISCCKRGKKL